MIMPGWLCCSRRLRSGFAGAVFAEAVFALLVLSAFSLQPSALSVAANVRWIGAAQDVAQVDTITIAGDWSATAETLTVTCNFKAVIMTTGATVDTTAEVAAALAEMLAANAHDPNNFNADVTVNAGGQEYGEFRDVEISVSGSVVTVTSRVPGVPFTITVSETSVGTATHVAAATAATGKNHFDAAKNWEGGANPLATDTIVFDHGSIDVLYGLANTTENISLKRTNDYAGNIGLMATNTTHSLNYAEYRQQKLDLPITASTGNQSHVLGERDSQRTAVGHTRVDLGTNVGNVQNFFVYDAPQRNSGAPHSVLIAGGNELFLEVYRGSVGLGLVASETATEISSLEIHYLHSPASDAVVTIKDQASFETSANIYMTGGTLFLDGAAGTTDLDLHGGTVVQQQAVADVNIRKGAVVKHLAGTMTNVVVFDGGTLDASNTESFSIAALVCYQGFTLLDAGRVTYTTGIDFVGCTPADGNFQVKDSQTWTPSAL